MLSLNANDRLENQPVVIRQVSKKTGQNNRDYYHLQVSYGIKSYDAKIWNSEQDILQEIIPGCVASITGTVKDFKGTLQIHIDKIQRIINPDQELLQKLTPTAELDEKKLMDEIDEIIMTVNDPMLNGLLINLFESSNIKGNFYKKAAGAEIHHAYMGGLAQHTLEVTKIVMGYCKIFYYINYDLAITCALLHDIGKVAELSNFPENKYTNKGRLLGHIALGLQIIDEAIKEIEGFPNELKLEIEHCILSHHGSFETGSPVVPMTLEAIAVYNADRSSADINGFHLAIERDTGTDSWTDYNSIYKRCIKKS